MLPLNSQTGSFSVAQDDGVHYSLVVRTGDLQDPRPGVSVALLGPDDKDPEEYLGPTPQFYLPLGSRCHDVTPGRDKVLPFAITVVGQDEQNIPDIALEINSGQDTVQGSAPGVELEDAYSRDVPSPGGCINWEGTKYQLDSFRPIGVTPPYEDYLFKDSTLAGFLILKDFQAHQADFRKLALEVAPELVPNDAKKLTTMTQFSGAVKPDQYQNILHWTVTRGGMVPIVP